MRKSTAYGAKAPSRCRLPRIPSRSYTLDICRRPAEFASFVAAASHVWLTMTLPNRILGVSLHDCLAGLKSPGVAQGSTSDGHGTKLVVVQTASSISPNQASCASGLKVGAGPCQLFGNDRFHENGTAARDVSSALTYPKAAGFILSRSTLGSRSRLDPCMFPAQ
jgi:hypothetical protein